MVLIPSAQDNKTLFTTIFDDTTIEPLKIKLRSIMDAQLNTTHLVAERGKVATTYELAQPGQTFEKVFSKVAGGWKKAKFRRK